MISRPITGFAGIALQCALIASFLHCDHVQAQGRDRTVPRTEYFLAFGPFNDGDFRDAGRMFNSAAKSGIRSSEGRWVDSICYHTMLGECHYRMGNLSEALNQYDAAVRLMIVHQDWLLRIEFPPNLERLQRTINPPINWGRSQRNTPVARIPDTMSSRQGRINNIGAVVRGGVVTPAQLFPLRVPEIVRCSALALRRRREIMGPTCQYSELTNQVLESLTARLAPANHWSQSWIDVQLGMAYAAAGKSVEAFRELQKSLLVLGQYDHNLTSMALFQLGKLSLEKDQFEAASRYFHEATFAAAALDQFDMMEEAFRWGMLTHVISGRSGIFRPMQPATSWARRRSKLLEASLYQSAAENLALQRDPSRAQPLLDEASRVMKRTDLLNSEIGARHRFTSALVAYQTGNIKAGNTLYDRVMSYQRTASPRLFQIGLTDKLYQSGGATERQAAELFDLVLREPTSRDWVLETRDTLARMSTPHLLPMEHWFELTIRRKEPEKALQISDLIKRHRYFTTLPMGGRLLALRWILEGPREDRSQQADLQRRDLLQEFPRYNQMAQQAAAIRQQLQNGLDDTRRNEALKQLGAIAAQKEVLLREIALLRRPSVFAFPPMRDTKQIQASIPNGKVVLAFLATSRYMYAFAFSRDTYAHWPIKNPREIRKDIASMLREMGMIDKNVPLGADKLHEEKWKEPATRLLQVLTNEAPAESWDNFDELIVIPDGVLWYAPFTAMQAGDVPLLSKVRIRTVPFASMIVRDTRAHKPELRTVIIPGKMHPKEAEEVAQQGMTDLLEHIPNSVSQPEPYPSPLGPWVRTVDRLLVMSDIEPVSPRAPYDWSPIPVLRGKSRATLRQWTSLPFGSPETVILPSFHTSAEDALKRGGDGREIFLTACAMLASGSRTVVLSQWRTSGQSAYRMMRELTSELHNMDADAAYQRGAMVLANEPLDQALEPRVKPLKENVNTIHPFFWSGYMIIDTAKSRPSN